MINVPTVLKEYSSALYYSLQNLDSSVFDTMTSLDIRCAELAPFDLGCHGTEESDKVFALLHNNGMKDNPAVYWFEILSDHTASDIRSAYEKVQVVIGERTTPAIHKEFDRQSKVLYVGKGKKNISGRMFLHLGYEKKRLNLQGLQLCHWDYTNELKDLQLRLNIIYLPVELEAFAPIFENRLAKVLKPILGKHK